MATQPEQMSEPKTEFKIASPLDQIEMVESAVKAVLDNFDKVEVGKSINATLERGQLGILANALKNYPEPMTEEVWNRMFKSNVSDLLSKATINGNKRYANPSSRDVMVNLFKVATMGLTLAKMKPEYQATTAHSKNLKKYAAYVRPMLQADLDDATGNPRLKSIAVAPREPRDLWGSDSHYWLIGCDAEARETILARDQTFSALKRKLEEARLEPKFKSFFYLTGKAHPIPVEEHEIVIKTLITSPTVEVA
jgi:hypothetical protein